MHLNFLYVRIGLYEFGLLTDNVEYHKGTEFLKADRLGSICRVTYTAFFISERNHSIFICDDKGKRNTMRSDVKKATSLLSVSPMVRRTNERRKYYYGIQIRH